MDTNTSQTIHTAVTEWARARFHTGEIVIADVDPDDEPEQYLVLAARPLPYWLAAEVWLDNGQVKTINDLGEGVPLLEQAWPWPEDAHTVFVKDDRQQILQSFIHL